MLSPCRTGPHTSQGWCTALQSPEGWGQAAQEPGSHSWSRSGARCLTCTSIQVLMSLSAWATCPKGAALLCKPRGIMHRHQTTSSVAPA